jgi:sulfate adenylyltransferase subunit 1 (EFTu-like GTPase family)
MFWVGHEARLRLSCALVGEFHEVPASLTVEPAPAALAFNDIGQVRLRASAPLAADTYTANRATGAFILISEATNATVAAGMLGAPRFPFVLHR